MFELVEGDLEPDMPLTVTVDGVAQDLTAASLIQFYWVKPDGTSTTVTLTPVSLAAGTLKLVWSAGDSDVVGYHRGRVKITWPSNDVQHFPNDGSWVWWAVYERDS